MIEEVNKEEIINILNGMLNDDSFEFNEHQVVTIHKAIKKIEAQSENLRNLYKCIMEQSRSIDRLQKALGNACETLGNNCCMKRSCDNKTTDCEDCWKNYLLKEGENNGL